VANAPKAGFGGETRRNLVQSEKRVKTGGRKGEGDNWEKEDHNKKEDATELIQSTDKDRAYPAARERKMVGKSIS